MRDSAGGGRAGGAPRVCDAGNANRRRASYGPGVAAAAALVLASSAVAANEIAIHARHLYGPGPFPDQELGAGHVKSMIFSDFMRARVPAFNNGPEEPNVSGEARQGTPVDGRMSDGTLINENIDMGNAVIMNGQFNLLLGAVFGGPHGGNSDFFLDDDYNWTINDDIAIDAGIPEAIVKINNFTFSTGPRLVPPSIQTERGYPGGVDKVGSIASGDVVVGRVGDDDMDGYVDGVFMAMGRFPLSSVILPGTPFVQSVEFRSDIPIRAFDAALLSVASARNSLRQYVQLARGGERRASIDALVGVSGARLRIAVKHLQRAAAKSECAKECGRIEALFAQARQLSDGSTEEEPAARLARLDDLFESLQAMHLAEAKKEHR